MFPRLKFVRLLFGYKITQCLYVAAKLNIADHLVTGSKTADELARLLNVKPEPLYRVLRCLASLDVFNENTNKSFSLNETAEMLISSSKNSLRDFAVLCGTDLYKATSDLFYSVETGLPAFDNIYGMNFWDYLDNNPDNATLFHDAMTKGQDQIIKELIKNYDFSPYKKIIDIGGGQGHVLCGILSAYQNMLGTVYDLSNARNLALRYINYMNLSERCNVVTGNFLETVPPGGDIYLLKVVLHDWDDERAIAILKNCRKEMTKYSKLIIIEKVIDDNQFKDLACLGDINMLVTLTGKERSLIEFKNLLNQAGFDYERKIDTTISFSIIEASPVF